MPHRPGLLLSIEGIRPGDLNMADDADALRAAETGVASARAYRWPEPSISLGRFQRAADVLRSDTAPVVVRPTGGAAVYHGHDLTLSLAVPLPLLLSDARDVDAVYRAILAPVLIALRATGVAADLPRTDVREPRSAYCFGSRAPFDVVRTDTGQKCAGAALRITRAAALLQVSVPVQNPQFSPGAYIADATTLPVPLIDLGRLVNAYSAALRSQFTVETRLHDSLSKEARCRAWLWNIWDPIGVNEEPTVADEYDAYVPVVTAAWDTPAREATLRAIRARIGLSSQRE